MKTAFALLVATAASLASAGVVITPVFANQVVPTIPGDCYFGVSTPQGCAPLRKDRVVPAPKKQ